MNKYNGKFKNLVAKKNFCIGDNNDVDIEIAVNQGEECTCIEYNKTSYLTSEDEALPYKVVFKSIVDCMGNYATQYFDKNEIENFFNIKGAC